VRRSLGGGRKGELALGIASLASAARLVERGARTLEFATAVGRGSGIDVRETRAALVVVEACGRIRATRQWTPGCALAVVLAGNRARRGSSPGGDCVEWNLWVCW